MTSNHKVLISGIPRNFPKDALVSRLLNFGDMVTIFVSDANSSGGKKSAFVVYKTKLECYRAITELNGQPPCYLKMHYGGVVLDEESNYDAKREVSVCHYPYFQRSRTMQLRTQPQHSHISERVSQSVMQRTWGQFVWGEVVEKKNINSQTSRRNHGLERAWSRRNHSHLGIRYGHSPGEIATGQPDFKRSHGFESGVQGPHVVKENDSYAGESQETGDRCLFCGKLGDYCCEICGATYCSEICIRKDWFKHKYDCSAMKHDGKESSPGSENYSKQKQSARSAVARKSPRESLVQPKSITVKYKDEQGGESDDSLAWSSMSASLDEENPKPPMQKKRLTKKLQSKRNMCSTTSRGATTGRDAVANDLVAEKKDDFLKCGSTTPKMVMGRKNLVDFLITEKKDDHLNYSPTTQNGAMWKRKSVESDFEKGDDFVESRSNASSVALPKRNAVVSDSVTKKEDECLKSSPSKNGMIKKSHYFNDNRCDEILDVTFSDRTSAGVQVTNSTSRTDGKDSACSVRVNTKSTFKTGNDFISCAASRRQHNDISGPHDESIEQKGFQESRSTKCTPPLLRKVEKLISLQNQQKMTREAKCKDMPACTANLNKLDCKDENLSCHRVAAAKLPQLSNSIRTSDLSIIQGAKSNAKSIPRSGKEMQAEISPKVQPPPEVDALVEKIKSDESPKVPVTRGAASRTPAGWNLVSNDPKTQIVNYDLCTQQKKLPVEAFLKVVVLSRVKPGEYLVQSADKEELNIIQKHLINKKKTSQTPYEPDVGEFCSVLHCDTWCRGRILAVQVTEIVVALIDFGKYVSAKAEQLQELPLIARNFYAQAIRVKVDPRTPAQFFNCQSGDILTVKASGMVQGGVTNVQLEGFLYAREVTVPKKLSLTADGSKEGGAPRTAEGSQWPSSVLCRLKEGDEVPCVVQSLRFSEEDDQDEFVVVICCETLVDEMERISEDLQSDCMKKPADSEFNPSVGDMVAAFSNRMDCWVRSIVMDVGHRHWLVGCIDFGFLEEVMEIRDIPVNEKYGKIFAFCAAFSVTKSLFSREDLFCEGRIEPNVNLHAKILKKEDDFLECKFGSSGDVTYCFGELRAWSPKHDCSIYDTLSVKNTLPDPSLDVVTLTSGCPVKISTFYDSLVIYVRPCDAESESILEMIHQGLANTAVKSNALKEVPVRGKKCICRYSGDSKYYRAVVQRVKSPEEIFIRYIDYGNEETVPKERLFELPPELEEIPCYGVKIELKKDFDNTLNKDMRRYLSILIVENKELILKFSDGNLRSADLLFNGRLLSDNLKRMMNP